VFYLNLEKSLLFELQKLCNCQYDCISYNETGDFIDSYDDESNCTSCSCGYKCANSMQCIRIDEICDGQVQCKNSDDELHCEKKPYDPTCEGKFKCGDQWANCIDMVKRCDGVENDCPFNADELNCQNCSRTAFD
jgi:low-density lipoprotein receptor-related protein 1 (alpha-2-macroglobulin receptor)